MDVYVVLAYGAVVGVSARLQGAELIRANWIAAGRAGIRSQPGVCIITNHDVQDME